MKEVFLADFQRLKYAKKKLSVIVLGYVLLFTVLISYYKVTDIMTLTRIFNMITIFLLSMVSILFIGELFEKKIIRYYFENKKNRYHVLIVFFLEMSFVYFVCNGLFLLIMKFVVPNFYLNFYYFCVYAMVFWLYLVIIINLIIWIKKVGLIILCTLTMLWILPSLINALFVGTNIFSLQLFYYLNPDDIFRGTMELHNIFVYIFYFLFFALYSFYRINKEEF